MNFFNKSAKLTKNSLLAKLDPIKSQVNANTYKQLAEQVNTVEGNLNYFKKKYPDLNTRFDQFEMGYIQALKNINSTSTNINYPDELKDILKELRPLVVDSEQDFDNFVTMSIFSFGMGLVAGLGGLDAVITGAAIAATGHVGAVIIGALLLTVSVVLIALGIAYVAQICSTIEKSNKLEEIETIIKQPLSMDPSVITSEVKSEDKMSGDEYTEETSSGYSY